MRFTSENVMHDLEVALRERKEMDWSNIDRLLLKAQLHIASLQRQLDYKELTDEEIAKVAKDFYLSEYVPYDFARAILRKAQNGHQS
jgi:hypothetical protein